LCCGKVLNFTKEEGVLHTPSSFAEPKPIKNNQKILKKYYFYAKITELFNLTNVQW